MLRYSREKMKVEDVKSEAFVPDFPQFLTVEIVKMKPELAVPLRGRSDHDPGLNERVPHPSAGQASPSIFRDTFCTAKQSISCICYLSKTYFVQHFPQKLKAEDVKTKLSCETSLKKRKLKNVKTKLSGETCCDTSWL